MQLLLMMKPFISVFFLFLPTFVLSQCTIKESTFPMYFGGLTQESMFHVLDFDPTGSGDIVVAGFTSDPEVLTGQPTGTFFQKPVIMVIERTNTVRWKVWVKELF